MEQAQTELGKLLELVQQGEEIIITQQGRAVAKLTPLAPVPGPGRRAWLSRLAELRERTATGKTGLSAEQILEEDRER